MKTKLFLSMAAVALLSSCGTQKQAVAPAPKATSPFGEVYSAPCEIFDTKDQFAATGIYRGSSNQKGVCHLNALANAKAIVREKYHNAYKGMISDYSGSWGNNAGNDIATKLERAGDEIVDLMLNDALESCSKYSAVGDDGMIECYVAISISKGEIATNVSKKVANVLTDEEKAKINFDEYNYRKNMEERMQNYKDSKK